MLQSQQLADLKYEPKGPASTPLKAFPSPESARPLRGRGGPAADWCKSTNYRTRVVVDPRRVLKEMGLELPDAAEIRVVDSTAETRYLVVPRRPEATEGWSEEQLVGLVTRNSMVGCSNALTPMQKEMMAD